MGPVAHRRILIVDRDADVAATLAELLLMDRHDVTVATTGSQAQAAMERRDFDVILLDPGIHLASSPGMSAIIGIASNGEPPEEFRGVRPYWVLEKPFRLDAVREVIGALLPQSA